MGNRALWWAVLALALGGGDCRGGHTTKQGNFYVTMLGGDAWAPLAAGGTHMRISVSPVGSGCLGRHDATFAQVGSSDPTVASFTLLPNTNDVEVEAVTAAPGPVDLQFLDDTGKVLDSVTIDVEQIAQVDIHAVDQRVQVFAAFTYGVEVTADDASGRPLEVDAGRLHTQTTGLISANQTDTPTGADLEVTATDSGTVTVSADTASAMLTVQTVLTTDITSIALGTGSWAPSYNPNDQTAVVWLTPMTATGEVYGVPCSWGFDNNGGIVIKSDRPATDLTQPAYNNTQFTLLTSGPHTVTCTIGSAQVAVTLHR
jgi:hypothetical protein